MGFLDLSVGGPLVSDVLVVKQPKSVDRHLICLTGKTADTGSRCQLIEAAYAVFLRQETNVDGLHGQGSLAGEHITKTPKEQARHLGRRQSTFGHSPA